MALLLPLLTLIICGTMQYGVLFFTYNSMLNSARNGARTLAVGAGSEASVALSVRASLPPWIKTTDWTVTPKDTTTTLTNQVVTEISIPAAKATVMPFAPMPDQLFVRVVMLKEA